MLHEFYANSSCSNTNLLKAFKWAILFKPTNDKSQYESVRLISQKGAPNKNYLKIPFGLTF